MNFFKLSKMKSPLVVGAMLLGAVACSDYDTEIAELNDRLDDVESLNVTISSMEEQIASVKASIPDLTDIYSRLEAVEGVDLDGLQAAIDGLNETVDASVKNTVTEEFLTNMLDNVYLTEVTLEDVQSLVGDENAGLISDIVDAKAAASKWVGSDELSEYLKITDQYTDDKAKVAASEYFETVKETLVSAAQGEELTASIKVNADAVAKLNVALASLKSRVAELEGRIQSLVFVPNSTNSYAARFTGKDSLDFGDGKILYLEPISKVEELTFRVSPASWAEKFTKENVSLYSDLFTRSNAPFTITDVTTGEDGKFTVSVKYNNETIEDSYYDSYGMALHIEIPAVSEEATTGTDFISEYVKVSVHKGDRINNYIYFGTAGSSYASLNNYVSGLKDVDESLKMAYSDTKTLTFFGDCDWYVKKSSNTPATKFTSLYSNGSDIFNITTPTSNAIVDPTTNSDKYTLTKTTAKIKTNSKSLVGNVITSKDYSFALKYNNETLSFGTAKSILEITEFGYEFDANAAYTFKWNYANPDEYASPAVTSINECINVAGISAEMFNKVYGGGVNTSATLYKYEDGEFKVSTTARATVDILAEVNSETDVKPIKVTLSDMGGDVETASYKVVYKTIIDNDIITINIPINFVGRPTISPITTITKSVANSVTNPQFTIVNNVASELWAKNSAALAGHMTELELYTVVRASMNNYSPTDGDIKFVNNSANKSYKIDGVDKTYNYLDVKYDISGLDFNKSYTLKCNVNNDKLGDEFTIFTANITITNPYATGLIANTAITDANGDFIVKQTFDGANGYAILTQNISNAYTIADISGVTLTYEFTDAQKDAFKSANKYATLSSYGTSLNWATSLNWGAWNKSELAIKVTAKQNDVVLATKEFSAVISDPFVGNVKTSTLNLYCSELTRPVDATTYNVAQITSVDLVDALELNLSDGSNVFAIEGYGAKELSNGKLTFTQTNPVLSDEYVTKSGTTVTLDGSADVTNAYNYTYKVVYKNTFFGVQTLDSSVITVTVHPSSVACPEAEAAIAAAKAEAEAGN